MTFDEILKELDGLDKENLSKILDKYKDDSNDTPPSDPDTPPAKDVKSDSVITMTAAEFMQVIERMSAKKEEPKKENDDDDEIFI